MRQMKLVSLATLWTLLLVPAIALAQEAHGNAGYGVTTPGRLWATLDAAAGLISAILAGLSLFRSAGSAGAGRRGAVVAAAAGLIVVTYAVLHLTMFTGGFGTGSGRAGAIVAIVTGLTGMLLAGITLTRSRRAG